jgi:hypothetical protein
VPPVGNAPPVAAPPVETLPPVAANPPAACPPLVARPPPVAGEPPVDREPPVETLPPAAVAPPVAAEPPTVTEPPVATTPPVATLPPTATAPPVVLVLPPFAAPPELDMAPPVAVPRALLPPGELAPPVPLAPVDEVPPAAATPPELLGGVVVDVPLVEPPECEEPPDPPVLDETALEPPTSCRYLPESPPQLGVSAPINPIKKKSESRNLIIGESLKAVGHRRYVEYPCTLLIIFVVNPARNHPLTHTIARTARIAAIMPLLFGLAPSGDGPDRAVTRTFFRSYLHRARQAHLRTAGNPGAFGPDSAPDARLGIVLGAGRCACLRLGNVSSLSRAVRAGTQSGHFRTCARAIRRPRREILRRACGASMVKCWDRTANTHSG